LKKSLAILVALSGIATAASAQSTVTIFGLVDLSIQHLRSGSRSALAGQSLTRLADGTVYGPGSRWGIRVSEDLGTGLKAGVLLESGFLADTGTAGQGGRSFGRQAYIWMSSTAAGEIRAGRQYMFHDETLFVMNPTAGGTALNPGGIYTLRTGVINPILSAPRIDNALQYLTPIIGGFRGQAMIALGEGTQDRYTGLKGTYLSGPVNVALAYEQSKALAPVAGQSSVNKILALGGNYDFGSFKVFGGLEHGKNLTTGVGTQIGTLTLPGLPGVANDLKAWNVGALMPIGSTALMANYTHSKFSNAAGAEVTVGRVGAGATYSLSKLTSVYAVAAYALGNLKEDVNEKQVYQVGLRKAF
jgi:GBP family porin